MSPMADDLLRYRSEFPILEQTNYMISNSLGAMPRGVYDALNTYANIWATRGVRAWEERWWMLAAQVGNELGALMNAPRGSVSIHQNVTTCQAVVASCFDFSGKRLTEWAPTSCSIPSSPSEAFPSTSKSSRWISPAAAF